MPKEKSEMYKVHIRYGATSRLRSRPRDKTVALMNLFLALELYFAIYLYLCINASHKRHCVSYKDVIVSKPSHGHVAHSILRMPALCPDSYFDAWSTLEM